MLCAIVVDKTSHSILSVRKKVFKLTRFHRKPQLFFEKPWTYFPCTATRRLVSEAYFLYKYRVSLAYFTQPCLYKLHNNEPILRIEFSCEVDGRNGRGRRLERESERCEK